MIFSFIIFVFFWKAAVSESCSEGILLNDGYTVPPICLGTYGVVSDLGKVKDAVIFAIENGFRCIDTSAMYLNEEEIGEAIINVTTRGIVKREELFITTKLDNVNTSAGVMPALQKSLTRLQLGYVDLYLIHAPLDGTTYKMNDNAEIWKGMEETVQNKMARSIGVSNFNSTHINNILVNATIPPAVNEIEVNPTYQDLESVAYCQSKNIAVFGYAPWGFLVQRPFRDISPPPTFEDPLLMSTAEKYNKTPSQVVLRQIMDRGIVPLPKSITKEHISLNIDVLDFSLTEKEVYQINEYDIQVKTHDYYDPVIAAAEIEYIYGTDLTEVYAQI